MITGRQAWAARALLSWTQEMLAERAVVALTALKRLASEPSLATHESTRDQVRRALEVVGIVFVAADRGIGVLLISGDPAGKQGASQPPQSQQSARAEKA